MRPLPQRYEPRPHRQSVLWLTCLAVTLIAGVVLVGQTQINHCGAKPPMVTVRTLDTKIRQLQTRIRKLERGQN